MKMKLKKVLLLAVLCLCICGCGKEKESFGNYPELEVGSEAPDFTAELTDGSSFTLSDQEGKVVLLNFWATWCSPCVGEMPAFERLYEEYGDNIEILAVNSGEEKEIVDTFLDERNYTFLIAYDEKNEISEKYPSEGIPYTLIIGKDGNVEEIFVGAQDADTQYKIYRRELKEVFEGK